ncbi:holo-ACP synthase [Clostridium septicum]|uniref:Holo-[acyl-carrier-protein] synthase n=1 Tax=Clostridium septicum TaxID=1504 RepID=A0A9N7JKB3_CLOSE|nr:holo-ACP synthase [Clostridium septicum]AYE34153.1 holo-ACP synthase [Clostridium septicum]MDU1313049.1 holo-ACP synthase [Clostridium septicum]QAS59521.1 holo-ACP synthase [Clostridium septicum]UEC21218.1 holo-ACP synthase [Clostridium septicum]USS00735.1 holo-ACP synthase [Clostridium septicum]
MIIGIGTDIIEIERIERAVNKTKNFLEKIFTEKEIKLFQSKNMRAEVMAGNFAAKEAISKAIGTGIRGFSLKDIEILRDELGKPIATLNENIVKILGVNSFRLNITISHNNTSAIAFAILEEI